MPGVSSLLSASTLRERASSRRAHRTSCGSFALQRRIFHIVLLLEVM